MLLGMSTRRLKLTSLARAVLAGTTLLACGPHRMNLPDSGDAGPDVGDIAVADAGDTTDAGPVRIYCWLVADPRCLPDGGAAPGATNGC